MLGVGVTARQTGAAQVHRGPFREPEGTCQKGRSAEQGGDRLVALTTFQERPADPNTNVDSSASPSVAQLAGRFREQAAAAKETPASKPTRRKPPCSLPLFPPKVELDQNGEKVLAYIVEGHEVKFLPPSDTDVPLIMTVKSKSPPNTSHPPKIKVKSSPLIEKLQANLAFDPTALLPGASPKSPGLKAGGSPFQSPPSTPSSPGVRSRASEPEEVPISFDQPPEGSHLSCYNKILGPAGSR
ncbi:hypothetical protein MC885_003605 [Smutsia gigantea]|nr:hypothetical protein MC885_003605 [Smutsia gigantea]